MMQDQNVSVSDALVMCRFLAPRNAHDTPCFRRHFFSCTCTKMVLLWKCHFQLIMRFDLLDLSIVAADLWRVHTVCPPTHCCWVFEDVIPDTFLMEADQVWQVGSFRDEGGGCWKDVGRAAPVFLSVSQDFRICWSAGQNQIWYSCSPAIKVPVPDLKSRRGGEQLAPINSMPPKMWSMSQARLPLQLHPSPHHATCPASFSSSVSASTELFVISNCVVHLKSVKCSRLSLTNIRMLEVRLQLFWDFVALHISFFTSFLLHLQCGMETIVYSMSDNKANLCRTLAAPFSGKCL